MIDAKAVWRDIYDKLGNVPSVCLYVKGRTVEIVGPTTSRARMCEKRGFTLCGLYTVTPSIDQVEMDLTA